MNEHVEFLRQVLTLKADGACKTNGIALSDERARGLLDEIDRLSREELRLCARLQEEREASRKLATLKCECYPRGGDKFWCPQVIAGGCSCECHK